MSRVLALQKSCVELEKARNELESRKRKYIWPLEMTIKKIQKTISTQEDDARNELLLLLDGHISIDSISHLVMDYLPDFWCHRCKNLIPFLIPLKGKTVRSCFVCDPISALGHTYKMRGLVRVRKECGVFEVRDQDDIHFAKLARKNGWIKKYCDIEGQYFCNISEAIEAKMNSKFSIVLVNLEFIYSRQCDGQYYEFDHHRLDASDFTKVVDDALWT